MAVDRRAVLTSGAALGASTLAAPAIAQERTEWRMVTTWPKNAPGVGVNAQRLADKIGQMSDGRLTVRLYAAGELVPAFEALGAVQQGNAELAHSAAFFWLGKSEALNYFGSMPFGLMASEIMGWLYFGGGLELWQEAMAEFDIRPFFAGSSGVSAGGWFRKEINSLDDLKGLKFRIAGLGAQVVQRLGATPVLTPPAEVFPGHGRRHGRCRGVHRPLERSGVRPVSGRQVLLPARLARGRPDRGAAGQSPRLGVAAAGPQGDRRSRAPRRARMEYHADYAFHNVVTLQPLVEEHGLELRLFPDDVVEALGRTSREVLAELGERTPLTRKIHGSYTAFLERANVYSQWFDLPMLRMRAAALGQV